MQRFLALVLLTSVLAQAQITDDFSQGGWRRFDTTPGTLTVEKGHLRLVDAEETPDWVTASKVFTVDPSKTPLFVVDVNAVSDGGTVKLIRKQPYDKQTVLQIDRPGLYVVDMAKRVRWKEACQIEVCLYAISNGENIDYAYVQFTDKLTPEQEAAVKERVSRPNKKLKVAPFEVVPLFNACSVYFASPKRNALRMSYRPVGGAWLPALTPPYMKEDGMYRGSIVNLAENTAYELRIADGDTILATTTFRTWASEVPIARTIVLDETNFTGHLAITESGTPEGWVRYTARPGFVLRNDGKETLLELSKAKYVVLDGLTLRGGLQHMITVKRCQHVRIQNCDLAGWGRPGVQRFDIDGKFFLPDTRSAIDWDCAILVSRSLGTIVERCYVHDPATAANSWYYSHPSGPIAVGIDKPESTVLRYNAFIGSDEHRWNDAVMGAGNFDIDGGFNRDADIYGNLMCFANDDAIEIDGGQINVRVFRNKFEGCLCGVSIQGCMASPSYVFQNLLTNMGDQFGVPGQSIKTSSPGSGPSAVSYILGNTAYRTGSDLGLLDHLGVIARNNIFAGRSAITRRDRSPRSDCDYNLCSTGKEGDEPHGQIGEPSFVDPAGAVLVPVSGSNAVGRGVPIPNFAPGTDGKVDLGAILVGSELVLPICPVPVALDRQQVDLPVADFLAGKTRTVVATVGGKGFSSPFRIAKNEAFGWFTVTPESGVLTSGSRVTFTLTPVPGKAPDRKHLRGAFLVRLADGYSRSVMVYAETDAVQATKPTGKGVWTQFLEGESPSGDRAYQVVDDAAASGGKCALVAGSSKDAPVEYRFRVPKDGTYFVLVRVRSDEPVRNHDQFHFAVDNGDLVESQVHSATEWRWSMVAHNRRQRLTCLQPIKLKAGEHTLRITPRESFYIDLIAITDNPGVFE